VLLPKMFNGSLYARRLPIGKEEILKGFKPEAIRRFYKDWYRPDLMAVMVVGDVDPREAERLVVSHFSKLVNLQELAQPSAPAVVPEAARAAAVAVTPPTLAQQTPVQPAPAQPAAARPRPAPAAQPPAASSSPPAPDGGL